MPDLAKQRLRSKFEARLLDAGAADSHAAHGDRKQAAIGAMHGTIVELGPGTGVNMRYYAPGVRVIAIEPNPVMHDHLRERAAEHGVDLEIRSLDGAAIDVGDATVDGVVCTLVLCGVDDPAEVVREAHRILRPGGTFFFIEHVVAPAHTSTSLVQKVLRRPHRWLLNGCDIRSDTAAVLCASQFDDVVIDEIDRGRAGLWIRHQIAGIAVKQAGELCVEESGE